MTDTVDWYTTPEQDAAAAEARRIATQVNFRWKYTQHTVDRGDVFISETRPCSVETWHKFCDLAGFPIWKGATLLEIPLMDTREAADNFDAQFNGPLADTDAGRKLQTLDAMKPWKYLDERADFERLSADPDVMRLKTLQHIARGMRHSGGLLVEIDPA